MQTESTYFLDYFIGYYSIINLPPLCKKDRTQITNLWKGITGSTDQMRSEVTKFEDISVTKDDIRCCWSKQFYVTDTVLDFMAVMLNHKRKVMYENMETRKYIANVHYFLSFNFSQIYAPRHNPEFKFEGEGDGRYPFAFPNGKNFFSYDYLVFPVNFKNDETMMLDTGDQHEYQEHWYIAVIDNIKKEIRSYDSQTLHDEKIMSIDREMMNSILNYVHMEYDYNNKKEHAKSYKIVLAQESETVIPQQGHGSVDCGIFSILYMESILFQYPIQYINQETIQKKDTLFNIRSKIVKLIIDSDDKSLDRLDIKKIQACRTATSSVKIENFTSFWRCDGKGYYNHDNTALIENKVIPSHYLEDVDPEYIRRKEFENKMLCLCNDCFMGDVNQVEFRTAIRLDNSQILIERILASKRTLSKYQSAIDMKVEQTTPFPIIPPSTKFTGTYTTLFFDKFAEFLVYTSPLFDIGFHSDPENIKKRCCYCPCSREIFAKLVSDYNLDEFSEDDICSTGAMSSDELVQHLKSLTFQSPLHEFILDYVQSCFERYWITKSGPMCLSHRSFYDVNSNEFKYVLKVEKQYHKSNFKGWKKLVRDEKKLDSQIKDIVGSNDRKVSSTIEDSEIRKFSDVVACKELTSDKAIIEENVPMMNNSLPRTQIDMTCKFSDDVASKVITSDKAIIEENVPMTNNSLPRTQIDMTREEHRNLIKQKNVLLKEQSNQTILSISDSDIDEIGYGKSTLI